MYICILQYYIRTLIAVFILMSQQSTERRERIANSAFIHSLDWLLLSSFIPRTVWYYIHQQTAVVYMVYMVWVGGWLALFNRPRRHWVNILFPFYVVLVPRFGFRSGRTAPPKRNWYSFWVLFYAVFLFDRIQCKLQKREWKRGYQNQLCFVWDLPKSRNNSSQLFQYTISEFPLARSPAIWALWSDHFDDGRRHHNKRGDVGHLCGIVRELRLFISEWYVPISGKLLG